ncbi:YdcF family protein [Actinomycetes bacterium M1A6_2h]
MLLLIAATVAGYPVYVKPQLDPLRPADAVVVLGGTPYKRFEYGIQLAEEGYAPRVLISNSQGAADPRMQQICGGSYSVTVDCFIPDPWTTRGEAEQIRDETARLGWKHIIVVTFTPHISRARYIVSRCFSGEITMVAVDQHLSFGDWVANYIYQTAGYAKTLTEAGC